MFTQRARPSKRGGAPGSGRSSGLSWRRGPALGLVLAAFVLGTAGAGCSGCDDEALEQNDTSEKYGLSPQQAARVVAKVGDREITLGDFAATLDRMDHFDRLRYQTKEKRRELLEEMIDAELLAQEAYRRELDKEAGTQEAIRQVLRDALLAEARMTLPTPTEISVEDVKAYYEQHIDEYSEPERRRVGAIVVSDATKAETVLEAALEAKDAKAWGELFYEHSENAGPRTGLISAPLDLAGDLGIVGPPSDTKGHNPKVPEPVRAAVYEISEVGGIHSKLVEADGKLYVVRLSGRTDAHKRSFEDAERDIRVKLLKQMMADQERELEAELRNKYEIKVDSEALSKVPLPDGVEPRLEKKRQP